MKTLQEAIVAAYDEYKEMEKEGGWDENIVYHAWGISDGLESAQEIVIEQLNDLWMEFHALYAGDPDYYYSGQVDAIERALQTIKGKV